MKKLKSLFLEAKELMRSVPSLVVASFLLSLIGMNLLANKSINLPLDFMALDAGILFSWVCFLSMDVTIRRFGLRAANILTVIGLLFNLFLALIFFLAAIIPGVWGESFVPGSEDIINNALNGTFRGTWYVLLGSSAAFLVSALTNNFLNFGLGKVFRGEGKGSFYARSLISTFVGQFVDNLVFALIVSLHFFGWTITQCFVCALTGAVVELLFEAICSPIGYRVVKKWEKEGVGEGYLKLIRSKKEEPIHENIDNGNE